MTDWGEHAGKSIPVDKYQVIVDYVLEHFAGDGRPYLEISVLGKSILGLLDSGASRTIIGSKGLKVVQELGLVINRSMVSSCTVANGSSCRSVGVVTLPVMLKGNFRLIETLVIPDIPHLLILGADFWRSMGVVPDLRRNEWFFTDQPVVANTVEHVQSVLTSLENSRLQAVIDRNMALMGTSLGCTNKAEHVIVTHSQPIKQRYYRVNPIVQKQIDAELDEMLALGVVEPSNSPWSSPILLVKKKDGAYRFCVDFRKLNAVTVRDSYPLPLVADTLDKLREAKYLSSLDVKSAYWQVPMAENSKQYTAFTVPNRGLFQFRRMPFGLHNAPATWQRLIDNVLGHDLEPHVFVYLDDVVIVTQTFEKHLSVLEEVFRRLREAKISVSWEKCQFCRSEMKYLGYVVDKNGLHVDPDKVKAMLELPIPTNVSEVRRIVGTFSWYRRFVPEFSSIVAPITGLLKKNRKFIWTDECENSFRRIKECLISAPILSCPDYTLPFVVQTDASGFGIGACLTQPHPEGDKVISYISRSLTRQEQKFSTTERECLAVVWAVEKLRPYLDAVPFTVVTDHYSLLWLQNLKDLNGRLSRWAVRLQQFDFKVIHRKGKDNVVPDTLSRSVPHIETIFEVSNSSAWVTSKDKWYQLMVERIRKNPKGFGNWREIDGRLWKHVAPLYPEFSPPLDAWKIVVPKEERQHLISQAHEPPTAGHVGVYKTVKRLAERYYWPKMRNDVARSIRRCRVCASFKVPQTIAVDKMISHPKVSRPFEMICLDTMGVFPRSKQGNCHLLVVTDYLSKFTLLFPLRNATGKSIGQKLEKDVFLLFGVPRTIICDNGSAFRSREFQNLVDRYGSSLKFTAHYNPRANPTERVNRVLKTMIAMYVSDNHRTWDEHLSEIGCAIRTSTHETTGLTPYFVNFGRNMILSGEDYVKQDLLGVEDGTQVGAATRNEQFRAMFADVKERLEIANQKSCDRYNLRRRHVEYFPNQIVWRKNYVLSDAAKYFTRKLAPKYIGPFFIKKRISPWTYELRDEKGNSKGVWQVKDLKSAPDEVSDL